MGHATLTNISTFFNRKLHVGPTTIKECADEMEKRGMGYHASEGVLKEHYMLARGIEDCIHYLYEDRCIEPAKLTRRQQKVFRQWKDEENGDWDDKDAALFDSIPWKAVKKRLPIIRNVTH